MPDVSDCSVSLQEYSGQKLQVSQSFPIGLDADLPIYKEAEHLLSAGGIWQLARLDDGAARDTTLPVSTAEAAGLRSPSLSFSQAIAVARLAARAAEIASASQRS